MQVKTNNDITRGILRRYMANYTGQRTAPKNIKGGFYAILICDTGEVWLNECQSFQATLGRFHKKDSFHNRGSGQADCVKQAILRGSELELWLLTQPARFSARQLENELYEAGLLATRKPPMRVGGGAMYSIRHIVSNNYFVLVDRKGVTQETLLSNWLARLITIDRNARNRKLVAFIDDYAEDILAARNCTITHICDFVDTEDEWLKRQCYIDTAPGTNMNLIAVD